MAFINQLNKEIVIKIAYHGTGLCGKTTNLKVIYDSLTPEQRGELFVLDTTTERTLFFDFLLVNMGKVGDYQVHLNLYTVPGQAYYDASRKLILNGADVVVFVVDSQPSRLLDNEQSLQMLDKDLKDIGLQPQDIPLIIQYNKRDHPESVFLDELQKRFNSSNAPYVQAIARHGVGVMETLHLATTAALKRLWNAREEVPPRA